MRQLATVAAFGFEAFDPPKVLAAYKRLGCQSCQIVRAEGSDPEAGYLSEITNEAGLPVDSIHGWFGRAYDPSHPDRAERQRTIDVYRRDAELAAALGGPMVVVHPGAPAPEGYEPTRADRRQRLDPLRRSIEAMTRLGETLGVTFLWENLPDDAWIGNDPVQIAELLREVDAPWARMCFDTGHARMTGDVAGPLAECADVIGYLHIHDNLGDVDDHRMPGDGDIDWDAVAETLNRQGVTATAMLELFYTPEQIEAYRAAGLAEQLAAWLNGENQRV